MISVAHADPQAFESAVRSVSSLVLGDLEVSADVVMSFPTPLWGFPDYAEYALVPAAREGLWWMQAMTNDAVTFLLADPFVLDATYGVDLGETERAALGIEQPADAFGLVMLTLPNDSTEGATANFKAPLVFNLARRVGMQVVSRDDAHELRRAVTLDVFPSQPDGVRVQ
ncbi:MAG: flagellar assembly protein FliW [Gemmatimonadaceae bacterium]|nr:flagellar assembly protein FliW [Gemmatimonadaceae bacterium]